MSRAPFPQGLHRPARAQLAEAMTETEWQALVVGIAQAHGWRVAHFPPVKDARGRYRTPLAADAKGWPDLFLAKPGRVVVIECKRQRGGRVEPEQRTWLDLLESAGLEVYVFRPADEPDVWRVLTGGAPGAVAGRR